MIMYVYEIRNTYATGVLTIILFVHNIVMYLVLLWSVPTYLVLNLYLSVWFVTLKRNTCCNAF